MQQTTNYALKKPDGTDTVDISVLNGNMDTIDSELKKRAIDNYAVTTNSGNAYSATINGITALVDGLQVRLKFNAGATAPITLNINGLGACKVFDYYGNQVSDVHGGYIANLSYDSGTGNFILQGKGGGGNAQPAHLLNGETATTNSGPITGTMANYPMDKKASNTQVWTPPSNVNGELTAGIPTLAYRIPLGAYLQELSSSPGNSVVNYQEPNLVSGNIKSGASIFGVVGKSSVVDTADATATAGQILSNQTAYVGGSKVTGTMANRPDGQMASNAVVWNNNGTQQMAVRIPNGAYLVNHDGAGNQEVQLVENNLRTENIKAGSSIFGVSGKSSVVDTSDGTATAGQILNGQSAYVNGSKLTGTMANNSSATNAISVGTSGTNKYFRIPYGAYLQNNGQGYPEIVSSATQIDSNIASGNIKSGISICGVTGTATSIPPGNTCAISTVNESAYSFSGVTIPTYLTSIKCNSNAAGSYTLALNIYSNGGVGISYISVRINSIEVACVSYGIFPAQYVWEYCTVQLTPGCTIDLYGYNANSNCPGELCGWKFVCGGIA
ncbi:hypothetical protein [Clostridium hydrogenum]|uniref:hypothetical protein n=1 Tax=Clostridium hydrogenum TaxID=2855764 RepID=UPI001F478F10|nr:hypothetical protein [Clostridium hydrogenum]